MLGFFFMVFVFLGFGKGVEKILRLFGVAGTGIKGGEIAGAFDRILRCVGKLIHSNSPPQAAGGRFGFGTKKETGIKVQIESLVIEAVSFGNDKDVLLPGRTRIDLGHAPTPSKETQ